MALNYNDIQHDFLRGHQPSSVNARSLGISLLRLSGRSNSRIYICISKDTGRGISCDGKNNLHKTLQPSFKPIISNKTEASYLSMSPSTIKATLENVDLEQHFKRNIKLSL